jgi:peptidylprolyl isomerase
LIFNQAKLIIYEKGLLKMWKIGLKTSACLIGLTALIVSCSKDSKVAEAPKEQKLKESGALLPNLPLSTPQVDVNVKADASLVSPAGVGSTASSTTSTTTTQLANSKTKGIAESTTTTLEIVTQIIDVKEGKGAVAEKGKILSVHFVAKLASGVKFESSRDNNKPIEFTLGSGQVIKGWEKGLVGMKVGGIRQLVVPPELGYGAQALPNVPAFSTLHFEIELLQIK